MAKRIHRGVWENRFLILISVGLVIIVGAAIFVGKGISPFPLFHTKAQTAGGITISTPSTSSPWSGIVTISAGLTGANPDWFCFLIDGGNYYSAVHTGDPLLTNARGCEPPDQNPKTFLLNTSWLPDGQHQLLVSVPSYGLASPITFTTKNGHIPYQLRANYNELWLTLNQAQQLSPKLMYADGTSVPAVTGTLTNSSTYPGPFKALYLGAIENIVGYSAATINTPDGVYDAHIRLQGLKTIPASVEITAGSPIFGAFGTVPNTHPEWLVIKTAYDGQGNGDLWFDSDSYRDMAVGIGQNNYHVIVTYPDGSTDNADSVMNNAAYFYSTNPSVASVDGNGVVTAHAIGDATIGIAYQGFNQTTLVHVNDVNITPNFGNDGSENTSYIPGKSTFIRSVFQGPDMTDPQVVVAAHAAQVNTFETGLSFAQQSNIASTVQNTGLNVIFTGDDFARGSDAVYATTHPTTNPSPLEVAMTYAKNIGHTIGVEMADEISFAFNAPTVPGGGQMGKTNGPMAITCVSNICTVTWPGWNYVRNGANYFMITGATSNNVLNWNPSADAPIYKFASFIDSTRFTFTATGVGTQTFTPATDPNLVIDLFGTGAIPGTKDRKSVV